MCVAVIEAAEGKQLPDLGDEYLKAVEVPGAPRGKFYLCDIQGSGHLVPGVWLVLAGIGLGVVAVVQTGWCRLEISRTKALKLRGWRWHLNLPAVPWIISTALFFQKLFRFTRYFESDGDGCPE
jgi:hypothetical protein